MDSQKAQVDPFPFVPLTWMIFILSRSSNVIPDLSKFFLVIGRLRWTFFCLSFLVFFKVMALVWRELRAVTASSYDILLVWFLRMVILNTDDDDAKINLLKNFQWNLLNTIFCLWVLPWKKLKHYWHPSEGRMDFSEILNVAETCFIRGLFRQWESLASKCSFHITDGRSKYDSSMRCSILNSPSLEIYLAVILGILVWPLFKTSLQIIHCISVLADYQKKSQILSNIHHLFSM